MKLGRFLFKERYNLFERVLIFNMLTYLIAGAWEVALGIFVVGVLVDAAAGMRGWGK